MSSRALETAIRTGSSEHEETSPQSFPSGAAVLAATLVDWTVGGLATGQLLGDRCRGTRVSFERAADVVEDARAVNVAVLPLVAARRARLRGRR